MSDIVTNTIDIHYPVAGVDNDSKGFRDNYARIQTALAQAKTELERFETHSVLKTPLTGTGTASNDLSEGTLFNGKYNKFYGTAYNGTITDTAVNISLWNGIFQKFVLTQDTTITFSHWPTSGQYGCIRLHLIAGSSTAVTLTSIVTTGNGTVIQEAAFPSLEITNLDYQAIEAYSVDGGATVFVRYLGRYVIPEA
jgi:hypothetical protein